MIKNLFEKIIMNINVFVVLKSNIFLARICRLEKQQSSSTSDIKGTFFNA